MNYGYELSLARVDRLIEEGGCDYKLSMDSLINYGHSSAGYDTCYVLAAYSASMEQQNTSKEDMMAKLRRVADSMFPVTSERKEHEHLIPVTYYRYEPVTLTVISSAEIVDFNGDDPVYSYDTETRTYYTPVEELSSEEDIMVPAYREVTVYLPVYNNGSITSYSTATYFEAAGEEMISPTIEMIPYSAHARLHRRCDSRVFFCPQRRYERSDQVHHDCKADNGRCTDDPPVSPNRRPGTETAADPG